MYHLGKKASRIRLLLPCVGYYWIGGPWRTLWATFGYDPRKNPAAKMYGFCIDVGGSFRQHTNLSLSKKKNCISSLSHLQTLVSPVSLASTEHVMHALIG